MKAPLPEKKNMVYGRVLEAGTNAPIPRTYIYLYAPLISGFEIYDEVKYAMTNEKGEYEMEIPEDLVDKHLFLLPFNTSFYIDWTYETMGGYEVNKSNGRHDFYLFKPGHIWIDCKPKSSSPTNSKIEIIGKRDTLSSWNVNFFNVLNSMKVEAHVPYKLTINSWVDGVKSTHDTTIQVSPKSQDTLVIRF